jgi:hypothetical protein
MKTADYVKKFKLNESDQFSYEEFKADLTTEFLESLPQNPDKNQFFQSVKSIKNRWDAINNKTVGQLPEKLWNYFYATVVIAKRKELFNE